MLLNAQPLRLGPVLWLLCCGLSQVLSQICEAQGWRSFECRELSSLKELKNVRDFPKGNLHRLSIRNEHTELSMGIAASGLSLSGLLDLDLSHVPQLLLERRGFSWLPHLEQLNISGCALEELLAAHFAANSSLQLLDASHNELPSLTKELFGNLRKLIYANFSHNSLQQLELPHMPLLQQLQLSHNQLTSFSFALCPQLQQLNLNDNRLSQLDATSFRGLAGLLELQLAQNALRTIGKDTFQPLAKLRVLNLSHNELDALRPQIFGSGVIALQKFNLSNNNIRLLFDNQFRSLGRLQVLDISHNSIVSLNAGQFAGLSSLRKLYLQSNDIIEIKAHTFAALEDLDTLDLSHNNIEYLHEQAFGNRTLQRMRKLNLNANNLKRLHALSFSSLPFVEYLSLGNNELSSLDVRMFAPMRRLQKLHLGHNELTHISSLVLESFSSLSDLLIDNNKLTFLPDLNGTLGNLKRMTIEGNPWQCACFTQLERWLLSNHVSYLRQDTGFYDGEKPLCVFTAFEYCVQTLQEDRHQDLVNEFEERLKDERELDVRSDED
ncbi:PREDICTED: insulin-like growth factor-binding protein complex acid labile subunit [Drosophila arizonae]|uniref:Insulin-like growth factor-binding protein complex acid labile subunit n=1 Tax=Drosophila arizonae TaxID=7263 RepID=A0ABM1P3I4_DROAR|nr:PREDICTED: insulin-like growth factor-binding protein complex acid labile subunit [Drosophila arizonae]